ncbi:MAG: hypothetical protein HND52_18305 [Ignavibacteriae bacterium]|nr:hypothetical protein [Ignavibacteriota bacterium]
MSNNTFNKFDSTLVESSEDFIVIGEGSMGGKAEGLAFYKNIIDKQIDKTKYPEIDISIPKLIVLKTGVFEKFMELNKLYLLANSDESDEKIAAEFQKAALPEDILDKLKDHIVKMHTPLAIRSSSMREGAKFAPFAGVYATKMIPNNQNSAEDRLNSLTSAIKFVYASTFFKAAKDYLTVTKSPTEHEKMAVIIQEVMGSKYQNRFYPKFSGVARSYNYYPVNETKPEEGVVNLALGLGKQIVDGGLTWVYSPTRPKAAPPFSNNDDLRDNTQRKFWSIGMEHKNSNNPTDEDEHLIESEIDIAETDGSLELIASTYSNESNRLVLGINAEGPRVLNFGMLLQFSEFNFNNLILDLLKVSEQAFESPVEIEFAVTPAEDKKIEFGFLQVHPMVVTSEEVSINEDELTSDSAIVSSNKVLGNGTRNDIYDIVFLKPENFHKAYTRRIALELEGLNHRLILDEIPYVLIGFGRWGSSDPWLGIPAKWNQISGARVIVESTLPDMNVELSQGSHFFHNLTSFNVSYFSVHHQLNSKINWEWLNDQKLIKETNFIKHVRIDKPLNIKVDGKTSQGVILK